MTFFFHCSAWRCRCSDYFTVKTLLLVLPRNETFFSQRQGVVTQTTSQWKPCCHYLAMESDFFSFIVRSWMFGLPHCEKSIVTTLWWNNFFDCLASSEWGNVDAEIEDPFIENPELKHSLIKAWSRSVYSPACYTYCQEFLPCQFLPFWSIHLHFDQNLSQVFHVLAAAITGSCVGLQNKIGHCSQSLHLIKVPVLGFLGISLGSKCCVSGLAFQNLILRERLVYSIKKEKLLNWELWFKKETCGLMTCLLNNLETDWNLFSALI